MLLKIFSVSGLLILLHIHGQIMDWRFYNPGWILHLAAGFFLAMFFASFRKKLNSWVCLILTGLMGIGWEFFECFYYDGRLLLTPDGWLDILYGIGGAALFLVLSPGRKSTKLVIIGLAVIVISLFLPSFVLSGARPLFVFELLTAPLILIGGLIVGIGFSEKGLTKYN